MARYAKVVKQKIANLNKPEGFEVYYAFRIVQNKKGILCGHYESEEEAEKAAHNYRCGANPEQLVCQQTKRLMKGLKND